MIDHRDYSLDALMPSLPAGLSDAEWEALADWDEWTDAAWQAERDRDLEGYLLVTRSPHSRAAERQGRRLERRVKWFVVVVVVWGLVAELVRRF